MKLTFIIAALFTTCFASCSSTRFVVFDSVTGNKKIDAKLAGNYGLVSTSQVRGNLGNGGKGGLLGAILPGFDYADEYSRTFEEAAQPTRIEVTEQGMIIQGIVDHSTGADIKGNATNRAIRNVSTLIGWLKTIGTVKDVNLANKSAP